MMDFFNYTDRLRDYQLPDQDFWLTSSKQVGCGLGDTIPAIPICIYTVLCDHKRSLSPSTILSTSLGNAK